MGRAAGRLRRMLGPGWVSGVWRGAAAGGPWQPAGSPSRGDGEGLPAGPAALPEARTARQVGEAAAAARCRRPVALPGLGAVCAGLPGVAGADRALPESGDLLRPDLRVVGAKYGETG